MEKQTVSERYNITQKMNTKDPLSQPKAQTELKAEGQPIIALCNQLHQSLLATEQSVQQMKAEYPENQTATTAHQRITFANQLLQQLKTTIKASPLVLPKSTSQQLKQLEYQVSKANGTLNGIIQSFESSMK